MSEDNDSEKELEQSSADNDGNTLPQKDDTEDEPKPSDDIDEKLSNAYAENESVKNKYLRAVADIENLRKRGENPKIQYFATIDFADNESLQLGIQRIHTRFNQRRLNPPSTTNRHLEGSSGERTAVIKNMARCSLPSDSELMRNGDTPLPDCEPANKRPRLERRSTSRNKRSLS